MALKPLSAAVKAIQLGAAFLVTLLPALKGSRLYDKFNGAYVARENYDA